MTAKTQTKKAATAQVVKDNQLTVKVRQIDEALVKADKGTAEVAALLVKHRDTKQKNVAVEATRLMEYLKTVIANDHYTIQHRNLLASIKSFLTCKLEGAAKLTLVKTATKNGEKVETKKDIAANRITAVTEAHQAAKMIREKHGATDGRSKNAPPKKATGAKLPQSQQQATTVAQNQGIGEALTRAFRHSDARAETVRWVVKNKGLFIKAMQAAGYTCTIKELAVSKKANGKKTVTRPAAKKSTQKEAAAK